MYDTDSGQRVQGICALHGRFHYDPAGKRVCPDCATAMTIEMYHCRECGELAPTPTCRVCADERAFWAGKARKDGVAPYEKCGSRFGDLICHMPEGHALKHVPYGGLRSVYPLTTWYTDQENRRCKDCNAFAESFTEDGDVCTDCDRESYLAGNIRA
jgi:hypothetical protein